jgi:hypothetical protein
MFHVSPLNLFMENQSLPDANPDLTTNNLTNPALFLFPCHPLVHYGLYPLPFHHDHPSVHLPVLYIRCPVVLVADPSPNR